MAVVARAEVAVAVGAEEESMEVAARVAEVMEEEETEEGGMAVVARVVVMLGAKTVARAQRLR